MRTLTLILSVGLGLSATASYGNSSCQERAEQYALEAYRTAFDRYMASCRGDDPPPTDCAGRLAAIHPYWSPSNLRDACNGAGADCVVTLAQQHTYWSPSVLNTACYGDYGNCAGRLVHIHPDWSSSSLSRACSGANADCVVRLAQQYPYWSPSSLNDACR